VLRLVYAANARRLVFRDLAGDAGGHVTLHLVPAARWDAWRADPNPSARYSPAGFEELQFVECADGDAEMLALGNHRHAGDEGAFVAVDVDLALVGAPWRYDDAGGARPHAYGLLPRDAVRGVRPVLRDAAGRLIGFGERALA
jgi:uncharacterized protein (DUF952 family)